ncbi:MAG: UDP-N-acetylglucosamine 1-carboxyvinyltransferase [Clostridiales bacterium]
MLIIKGQNELSGKPIISGAKNSMQFLINTTLLTDGVIRLENIPLIKDFEILSNMLKSLNCIVNTDYKRKSVFLCSSKITKNSMDLRELSKIRASILMLPGLLNRFGSVFLPYPGGDKIGARPLNTHFYILNKLGVYIERKRNGFFAKAKNLKSTELNLPFPSVTGTGLAFMLAAKIKGKTTICNPAKEPELNDLANILIKMGAKITGIGANKVIIEGSDYLEGAELSVMSDRLEVGTLILAAIASKGEITLNKNDLTYLENLINILKYSGCYFQESNNCIKISADNLKPFNIETRPYPGFPTDLQPQIMALMASINGTSKIVENLHDNRFLHVPYLMKMGADVEIEKNITIVKGQALHGANLEGLDIRGAAALIIAALSAKGESTFNGMYHIDRGYSNLCDNLIRLGADIKAK